jgi:hypothetical protein
VWLAFDTNDGPWTVDAVNDLAMVTVRTWLAMFAPHPVVTT